MTPVNQEAGVPTRVSLLIQEHEYCVKDGFDIPHSFEVEISFQETAEGTEYKKVKSAVRVEKVE